MVSNYLTIDAGVQDQSRPSERPPKTNWKIELLKRLLHILQYPFPGMVARFFWEKFRRPGRSEFTDKQKELIDKAETKYFTYKSCKIYHYKWGNSDRKILLSHGWNSKIADFRKMINYFLQQGYQVEGIDMKAHGKSDGDHTALPEIIEVSREYYLNNGPYHMYIGYSIGGLAAGLLTAELPDHMKPKKLVMIAAPPYTTFFFESTVKQYGFRKAIYHRVCNAVEEVYGRSITEFDLRGKEEAFKNVKMIFVYDEDDKTISFDKGLLLKEMFKKGSFIHTKGLGHYKIIAFDPVNEAILQMTKDDINIPNI
jgi:pimeloyl-ACP methyl ester carboxylesterase